MHIAHQHHPKKDVSVRPRKSYLYKRENNYLCIPFCTPNRHIFIWIWHVSIDFFTYALALDRGSHYEKLHTGLTKRTTVRLASYRSYSTKDIRFRQRWRPVINRMPFVNYIWPIIKRWCIVTQTCNCWQWPRWFKPKRVTKSIGTCRNRKKRYRFVSVSIYNQWMSFHFYVFL